MKTRRVYKLHSSAYNPSGYVIGTYSFWIVAWLRGLAYIVANPRQSTYIDERQIVIGEAHED